MAGIADLKAHLSATLARVKAGEEVLITEHGRPIARLVPVGPVSTGSVERLVRSGVLRPPTAPLGEDFWGRPRPADPGGAVLAALVAERAEGR